MKKLLRIAQLLFMIAALITLNAMEGVCQNLPRINSAFPDFTLSGTKGETVTLSELKGKNVMLVFPRGKVSDHWCQLCHYQYAELANLEEEEGIQQKYNLEIIYILPYTMDDTKHWVDIFPSQLEDVKRWKSYPRENMSGRQLDFMNAIHDIMPLDFEFDEDNPAPLPFPILADEDQTLSMGIKLFSTAWDGFYNEQNQPAIFILDEEGVVQFKYLSQETFDRLPAEYILEVMEKMI